MAYYIFHPVSALIMSVLFFFIIPKSKLAIGLNIAIKALYIPTVYWYIAWPDYGSFYLSYIYITVGAIVLCKLGIRLIYAPATIELKGFLFTNLVKLIALIYLTLCLKTIYQSSMVGEQPVVNLTFPFKRGKFYIHDGGRNASTNYHNNNDLWLLANRYALDIEKLNEYGQTWKNSILRPTEITLYNIFGDTIYSPCDGTILEAIDSFPDNPVGKQGNVEHTNLLVIEKDSSTHVVLFHIRQHSLLAKVQSIVREGTPLALVGNSGRSTVPHLHIGAYNPRKELHESSMLILFKGENLIRNSILEY
jgi:hypothetical protein